jgi:hypothetical protein
MRSGKSECGSRKGQRADDRRQRAEGRRALIIVISYWLFVIRTGYRIKGLIHAAEVII